ncbi:MAG: hypothetical protein WC811_19550 [Hyphomicrobium sp.]|jgi:hypothetical protein
MNHQQRHVNGEPESVQDLLALVEELRATLKTLGIAVFDSDLDRPHIQLLILIYESGKSCWKKWSTLAEEAQRRSSTPDRSAKPRTDKTIRNNLSVLHSTGYVRSFEAETPEAGGVTLMHHQIVHRVRLERLAEDIERELPKVVDLFASRNSRIKRPAVAGQSRNGGNSGTRIPPSYSPSKREGRNARNRASPPSLADALIADGHLVDDGFGLSPSVALKTWLSERHPGVDVSAAVADVLVDVMKVPGKQNVRDVLRRIDLQCRQKAGKRPTAPTPGEGPTPPASAPEVRMLQHGEYRLLLPIEHWRRVNAELAAEPSWAEKNRICAEAQRLQVTGAYA